jgi:hypothetical protein
MAIRGMNVLAEAVGMIDSSFHGVQPSQRTSLPGSRNSSHGVSGLPQSRLQEAQAEAPNFFEPALDTESLLRSVSGAHCKVQSRVKKRRTGLHILRK